MKNKIATPNKSIFPRRGGCRAFSLVEVVIALAICAISLVVMLGMLSQGITGEFDSREQVQAANMANMLMAPLVNSPTAPASSNALIPAVNGTSFDKFPLTTSYIDSSGQATNLAGAKYLLSYQLGYLSSQPNVGNIYIRLSWPPQSPPETAEGHYEVVTQVPIPQ